MKKVSKKSKDIPVADRHLGVLMEAMHSDIKQVLNGHAVLDKKIDRFHEEFIDFRNESNWKFNQILQELKELREGRVAVLEKKIDRVEKWISSRS